MKTRDQDVLRGYVSNTADIRSFETIPKEYLPGFKSDRHKMNDSLINREKSHESDPQRISGFLVKEEKSPEFKQKVMSKLLTKKEKSQEGLSEEAQEAYLLDSEYSILKTDRNHKGDKSLNNAYAKETSVPDKVRKEITLNPNIFHNKVKDSDDDDNDKLTHFSKTDRYPYMSNIHRNYSGSSHTETLYDKMKKPSAHEAAETEIVMDESNISNLRFYDDKMKNSVNESGKLQNSEKEEYDIYVKTNALGYVIASEDENSKIRRHRKTNLDDACQNNEDVKSKVGNCSFSKTDSHSHCCKHDKENNKDVSEIELLSKNFRDLFINENCWDTVLQVADTEFKVHRTVLVARSPVFSAMFQHDTSEKQTGEVKVPDCDPDSFKEFLEYLYSGKLENLSPCSALNLYAISDKYQVQELKSFCTKYLMRNITAENICDALILADTYDETELLSAIQEFFNKNFKEIVMSSAWECLLKKNFRLANKILIEKVKAE